MMTGFILLNTYVLETYGDLPMIHYSDQVVAHLLHYISSDMPGIHHIYVCCPLRLILKMILL